MLLEFCQRHFVLLSVVLGLLFSYIRRHSKLTNKDVNAVQSKRAAIEQLDIKSLRKLHTESKAAGYGGKTDLYTWKQSDSEVEVFIDLDKTACTESKNDIECALTHNTLTVSRSGKCFVQGTFYKAVDPHESVWQFDRNDEGMQIIWITLRKRKKTKGHHHWKCLLKGDPEIDTSQFGPPVDFVRSGDPHGIRQILQRAQYT